MKQRDNKAEVYLRQIRRELLKLLEAAPEFGSCGVVITFHDGEITKVTKQLETTMLKKG